MEPFVITGIDRIIFVDRNEYAEKSTSFSGNLSSNELILQLPGDESYRSEIFLGESHAILSPGMIRLMPKGNHGRHDVIRGEKGISAGCIDIFFQTDRPVCKELTVFPQSENLRMTEYFKKAFSVWAAKKEGYYFETLSLVYKIFAEISTERYLPNDRYAKIAPAVEYIEGHFTEPELNVTELAQRCGVSYSYLKRLFTEKFGIPPKTYLSHMRINYACDLLHSGSYRVTETANMAGYSNIYYFSRHFKEKIGVTPTEFTKKFQSSK